MGRAWLALKINSRRILKKTQSDTTKYVYSNDNILTETRTAGTQTFRKTYLNGLGTDNLIAYDNEETNLSPDEKSELQFCSNQVLSATGSFIKYGYQTIVDRCNTLSNSGSIIVTNRYFFHKNHLGSVVGLTNNLGTTVIQYQYDTFGNTYQRTTSTGSFTKIDSSTSLPYDNTRLFTSREFDKEIGLYYLRARYYDPSTGRFISRDPIGQNDQVNLYTYVGNNPMGFVDLMGLKGKPTILTDKERFEKISQFMQSKTFRNSLYKEGNTAWVDYLWLYSLQVSDWKISDTFSTINSAVRGIPQYDEDEVAQSIREWMIPTGLSGQYVGGEYWNKDKLQHFFKSAQIAYTLSISDDFDIGGATVEVLWQSKEIFLDELPHALHIKNDWYDSRDIEANRLGAQFGRYLRRYENMAGDALPSSVIK